MFHKCFTEQGRPSAVRRRGGNCFTEIVSRVILGVCVDSVRFRYARSVPPLLFWLVLRLGCVLWCVAFVLRLKIKRICDDRIKLDKIYGFSFFVRLRAYFGLVCFWFPFGLSVRPSGQGCARPYFLKSTIPTILPYYSPKKNFFTFKG